MSSKGYKQIEEYIEKRKVSPLKTENIGDKKQAKNTTKGIVRIIYKIDKNLLMDNKNIKLFGEEFVKKNKNKCNIIIDKKEYEIMSVINS